MPNKWKQPKTVVLMIYLIYNILLFVVIIYNWPEAFWKNLFTMYSIYDIFIKDGQLIKPDIKTFSRSIISIISILYYS